MCICAYIVSSRTQVKQVKFTLVQTNVIKHVQVPNPPPVFLDGSESFLFGELSLIEGARLIVNEGEEEEKNIQSKWEPPPFLSDLRSVGGAFSLLRYAN